MRIFRKILPLLAMALACGGAAAERLTVTATVVATCRLSVSVPKVGTAERTQGGLGSFAATCTRGGTVSSDPAAAAGDPAALVHRTRPEVRMTKGITPNQQLQHLADAAAYADTTVAEVLF